MELTNNYQIHHALKKLIESKVARDQKKFTVCQLAKALGMPHSMLVKLIHPDPEKRVINPRIDTLAKIVSFFRTDGFDITIEDLLNGLHTKNIDITEQMLNHTEQKVSVYSFGYDQKNKLGYATIQLPQNSKDIIALLSDEDIMPFFKKNSLFIIDRVLNLENNQLVAVKIFDYSKVAIKRLIIENQQMYLYCLEQKNKPIKLLPTIQHQIIGVVIQVNAKT